MPDVAEVGRCRKLDITNAEFPKDRSYHRYGEVPVVYSILLIHDVNLRRDIP
ncbi:hypothetical protein J6590_096308 [Homalodisca vitripennis]|nr:hypothetical protein J6590_096308 [Homalodisca vitripennis]